MTTTIEQTYPERAKAMTAAAVDEFKRELVSNMALFKRDSADARDLVVSAVNRARTMGGTVQSITGHEKLLLSEYNSNALTIADAGFEFLKECLTIRRAYSAPLTTYAAAKPIFDRLMVQMDLMPQSVRELAQPAPPPVEPIEMFLHNVGKLASEYAKMDAANPVENWEPFYRQTFLNESARIVEIRERVLKML